MGYLDRFGLAYFLGQLKTVFVTKSDVVNALSTTEVGKVLDGRQGKALADLVATAQNTADSKASTATYTATFLADGWSSDAPYTQTVNVSGILGTDNPIVDVVALSGDTATAQLEAFGYVGQIVTDNGTITATCFEEKPSESLSIQLKTIR